MWPQFKEEYFRELAEKRELADIILEKIRSADVTLLFAARNEKFNNAVALKEYLEKGI